jgi:hypothetical protein
MFQHLLENLPRRVEAVIAAKGGSIPYSWSWTEMFNQQVYTYCWSCSVSTGYVLMALSQETFPQLHRVKCYSLDRKGPDCRYHGSCFSLPCHNLSSVCSSHLHFLLSKSQSYHPQLTKVGGDLRKGE